MTSLATTSHCNTDTFTFSLSPNLKCTHREPSLNRMSISPPIHTDDLDTLPDNTELIGSSLPGTTPEFSFDTVLTERSRTPNPDAASTTAPTDVADIKTSSTGDVYVTKAYDTYKLESDLTLDWRHTHNDGNLAPIALHE